MDNDPTFYEQYKELILIGVTALATLLATKLLPWLGGLVGDAVKAWKKGHDAGQARTSFEERYRRYVAETYRFLQVTGIKTRTQVSIELDRVYVGLELRRRVMSGPPSLQAREFQQALFDASEALRQTAPFDSMSVGSGILDPEHPQWRREASQVTETYEVGEALRVLDDRIVILGAPGSGKTTLIRYLAVTFADRKAEDRLGITHDLIPILLPLRDWVNDKQDLTPETLGAYVLGKALEADCPDGFFRQALLAGRCLVLLDGMDEVSTEGDRARVAKEIDALVAAFPKNRFVVTSRPAGYEGVSLSGFTVLRVRDFTDEDVEAFARRWSLAVEIASRGLKREEDAAWAVAEEDAERQADDLVRAIREKDRVRQLAVNPLLLTIVGLSNSLAWSKRQLR